MTDSLPCCIRVTAARCAAAAASSPCPKPSTTATRTPLVEDRTTCRSPDAVSPGSAAEATPQSRNGGRSTAVPLISTHPLPHGHYGPLPWLRLDFELVHQAPRAREPQAQAA